MNTLIKTSTLWMLFAATIAVTLSFVFLSSHFGMAFIDPISDPDEVRAAIAGFSSEQKVAHAWITATVDVLYPLVYGLLFAGVGLRFFPSVGIWIALPGLLAIPVDLIEGVVQVLALLDINDLVEAKAFLTPLKSLLFIVGLLISIAGWGKWLYLKVKKS